MNNYARNIIRKPNTIVYTKRDTSKHEFGVSWSTLAEPSNLSGRTGEKSHTNAGNFLALLAGVQGKVPANPLDDVHQFIKYARQKRGWADCAARPRQGYVRKLGGTGGSLLYRSDESLVFGYQPIGDMLTFSDSQPRQPTPNLLTALIRSGRYC